MNKIGLIIWREYTTRVRKKSFLIMTILGPVLIIGAIIAVAFLGMQESGPQKVYVYDQSKLFPGKLKNDAKAGISYDYAQADMPDSVFRRSDYTLLVYLPENIINKNEVHVRYKDLPSQTVQNHISNEIQAVLRKIKLERDSLDEDKFDLVSRPVDFQLFDINKGGQRSYDEAKALLGFGFGYLIFLFVFLYGVQVMRGVMEEKQNRIVEVLVSSVKPFQLMMGKIIGIAMVGLTQYLIWVLLITGPVLVGVNYLKGEIEAAAVHDMHGAVTTDLGQTLAAQGMPEASQERMKHFEELLAIWYQIPIAKIAVLFVFYFLAGYLLYSSLFAAVGAAVDSETDTQQFMFPITIPMMIAIFIAQTAVYNPGGPAVLWSSLVPFTAPVVMMVRVATGNAFEHPWQLFLSMALLVATFIFTTWLAGRIYRTGILMYGKKVTWKELGKWLFYRG